MPHSVISVEQIGKVMRLSHCPNNVRFNRWLEESIFHMICPRFILWRLREWVFGSSLFDSNGQFIYRRLGKEFKITFNGRNAQYSALYDKHYACGYELETATLISRLACGEGAFYDIGANWGYFSLLVAALPSFKGHICAFEPNPRTFTDLKSTVAQAGLDGNVTAMKHGLGSENRELTLVEEDKFKTGHAKLSAAGKGLSVPVRTLDSLEIPPPVLIKIDAEFMEMDILMGGEQLIRKHHPFIVFENFLSFDTPNETYDTLKVLKKWGYRLFSPGLLFNYDGTSVIANYGDDFSKLMNKCSSPQCVLTEITTNNRFLLRGQINVFSCHEERLNELDDKGCVLHPWDEDGQT